MSRRGEIFARVDAAHRLARDVADGHTAHRAAIREALRTVQDAAAAEQLDAVPVARLRDAAAAPIRIAALEQAGYATVGAVLRADAYRLRLVPGIGRQSADRAHTAARALADAARDTVAVRLDSPGGDRDRLALLAALNRDLNAGPDVPPAAAAAALLIGELEPLLADAEPARHALRLALGTSSARRRRAREAVEELAAAADRAEEQALLDRFRQAGTDLLRPADPEALLAHDVERRPAEYYALLAEAAELEPDPEAAEGFVPDEIAQRVREQPLDTGHLRASLRGYQAFGARFLLVQRRALLGDEMGLGKTVQAVAVLAHLRARGATHFLVVCPASVLIHWLREVAERSVLAVHRLHGPERASAAAVWVRDGGVAVTTYEALAAGAVPEDGPAPAALVVDEAHFVKNPATHRARAVAREAERAERVAFLTGTPMENRVGEFRSLVERLRPEVAERLGDGLGASGARAFRRDVAPCYLRRNQQDVLAELPGLVRVDEWQELSERDREAYAAAVADGGFMAMRRAAYAVPAGSAKLARLRELVAEARENGAKVLVFSFFREVLEAVAAGLGGGPVHGPITGSTPAERRQRLADGFAAAEGHAVLLAQVQAGGTGLNLQAASVVILCEPQVKPTLESQAAARAHRMGQLRTVTVHRLLARESVDERLLDLLAAKERAYDRYARRSETAEAAPEAVDVSEAELARRIVEEEQVRLAAEKAALEGDSSAHR